MFDQISTTDNKVYRLSILKSTLILFSVGTMLSMAIMTIILALPFRYNSSERISNYIIGFFGLLSVALGAALGSDIALGTSFTDVLWY